MQLDAEKLVCDVIKAHPETAHVFERHGVPNRHRPDISLTTFAAQTGIAANELIRALGRAVEEDAALAQREWASSDTKQLLDYIEQRHHPFVRYELYRLDELFKMVLGPFSRPPEPSLQSLRGVFNEIKESVTRHLEAEEQALFPWLAARAQGKADALADCEADGYRQMKLEHECVERFFIDARRVTGDYVTPPGASKSLTALYGELAALDADMRKHIRMESDYLWPGVVDLAEPSEPSVCPRTGHACSQGDPATCREFWDCVRAVLAQRRDPD
jgi:regulator of cell morphogenesis and NO signaling